MRVTGEYTKTEVQTKAGKMKDSAARPLRGTNLQMLNIEGFAGSSNSIYELLKTPLCGTKLLYAFWLKASSGVSQETWMMDAASGGEFDPSERPEAQYPIIRKNREWNEQASGRPITAAGGLHPSVPFFTLPVRLKIVIFSLFLSDSSKKPEVLPCARKCESEF